MIPYGRHSIDQNDIDAVIEVLKSDWLTCGSAVTIFEQSLEKQVNTPYAVACSNGTTALHLALLALGIGPEDKVIVPAVTFLATANAVRYIGAEVIFADVDPDSGLLTANTLQQTILSQKDKHTIKAVINVHLAGQCENIEEIYKIAKKHDLFIIEDAAHAIGTNFVDTQGKSNPIGSNKFSDLTTFSFHPVKTVALGEGGAVTTNNPEYDKTMRLLRSHGMIKNSEDWQAPEGFDHAAGAPNPWYYEMHSLGYNYRVSDINCALGIRQLSKIFSFKNDRTLLSDRYDAAFNSSEIIRPIKKLLNSDTAWHLYCVKIDFHKLGKSRAQVMNTLKENGIGSQVHYIPLYKQPYYKNLYGEISLPGAETYYAQCLSLPLYVGLSAEQQDKIIKVLLSL